MYRKISKCRICGNTKLRTVLDLGNQCLTGVFPKNADCVVAKAPLELVKCYGEDSCGLVQLRHSCDSTEMYGMNYGYRSGLNMSMVVHLKKLTQYVQKFVHIENGDVIVDIGSNDGTLLGLYDVDTISVNRIGIDPTAIKFKKYYQEDITIIEDFFSADNYKGACGDVKAKIITSIAMFYDLEDPIGFAKQIEECLAYDGIWVFEQSYMPFMIQTCSFDTVCQEHLEYYTVKQIDWITKAAGLKIVDIDFNDTNGGSFRVTAAKKDSLYSVSPKVELALISENIGGYNNCEVFDTFGLVIDVCKKNLLDFFAKCKADGKKVLGYGASTKGNVLLQYFGITTDEIECIAEVNEDKFGRVTPGTCIPIVSEEEAKKMNPDYFLVLPWHFKNNILEKESRYIKESGCRFVFPLPNFTIEE